MNNAAKSRVLAFFKQAFAIDGEAELLATPDAKEVIATHIMRIIKLQDSQRGTFYVATFRPKI